MATSTSDREPDLAHPSALATPELALEDSIGFRLARLVRVRRERWATELRALDITPAQAAILRATRDRPGQALRALARTLQFDAMSVKRCVDELESRGWVATANREDDRRVRVVTLSTRGRTLISRLDEFVRLQERTLRAQVTPTQLEVFAEVLGQLERAEGIDDVGATTDDEREVEG